MQLLILVGLHEQRWPEDLLTRSAMALVLLGILRASGYFGIAKISTSADTYTNNELFIGSLLLRHLQVLLFNMPEHIYNSHYGNAMGCRQCLPLSVVQLKGKHCQKPHCRNGVVDTFGQSVVTFLAK